MMAASFGGHVSRLDRNGWTLVQGVLSPQECTEARGALLHLWQGTFGGRSALYCGWRGDWPQMVAVR